MSGDGRTTGAPGYEGYRRDLVQVVASEVYGRRAFTFAARTARDPVRRAEWRTLAALEEQTLERIVSFLASCGLPVPACTGQAVKGAVGGAALPLLPRKAQMALLAQATRHFIPIFTRLARAHAGDGHAGLFAYVLDHELALAEFARRSAGGHPEPLAPVRALLGDGTEAGRPAG